MKIEKKEISKKLVSFVVGFLMVFSSALGVPTAHAEEGAVIAIETQAPQAVISVSSFTLGDGEVLNLASPHEQTFNDSAVSPVGGSVSLQSESSLIMPGTFQMFEIPELKFRGLAPAVRKAIKETIQSWGVNFEDIRQNLRRVEAENTRRGADVHLEFGFEETRVNIDFAYDRKSKEVTTNRIEINGDADLSDIRLVIEGDLYLTDSNLSGNESTYIEAENVYVSGTVNLNDGVLNVRNNFVSSGSFTQNLEKPYVITGGTFQPNQALPNSSGSFVTTSGTIQLNQALPNLGGSYVVTGGTFQPIQNVVVEKPSDDQLKITAFDNKTYSLKEVLAGVEGVVITETSEGNATIIVPYDLVLDIPGGVLIDENDALEVNSLNMVTGSFYHPISSQVNASVPGSSLNSGATIQMQVTGGSLTPSSEIQIS